jgi:hypothetical protein
MLLASFLNSNGEAGHFLARRTNYPWPNLVDAERRLNREDESATRKARGTKPSNRPKPSSNLKEAAARGDE